MNKLAGPIILNCSRWMYMRYLSAYGASELPVINYDVLNLAQFLLYNINYEKRAPVLF
jgi:hypothetical protein